MAAEYSAPACAAYKSLGIVQTMHRYRRAERLSWSTPFEVLVEDHLCWTSSVIIFMNMILILNMVNLGRAAGAPTDFVQ